jgi:hypothetical protein
LSIPQVGLQIDSYDRLTLEQVSQASRRIAVAGLCSDVNNDDWFPVEPQACDQEGRANYEETARIQCLGCPTQSDCLVLALFDEEKYGRKAHGIFGGRAPWERDALRRNVKVRRKAAEVKTVQVQAEVTTEVAA